MEEEINIFEKYFDNLEGILDNLDNLHQRTNIKVGGLRENVEGRDLTRLFNRTVCELGRLIM